MVDEASMLDTELAAALLEACGDGCHLVLVGDPEQLPSIGPGRVLGDLVESGAVPVTALSTLYRSAEGGGIARLATAVRAGELPRIEPDPAKEVVVVLARDADEAAHRTVQLVTDSIPRALGIPAGDVQVVTPVHRGPAGTVALNAALKARLNPGDGAVGGFDVGDRVVATANHASTEDGAGWANGDLGVVTATTGSGLSVDFTGAGPVDVGAAALGDLAHGWALTVHRAQGSEFPAVVAVLPADAGGLLSRPLVYTAFTRAQRHLSVVHAAGAGPRPVGVRGGRPPPPHAPRPAPEGRGRPALSRTRARPGTMEAWRSTSTARCPSPRTLTGRRRASSSCCTPSSATGSCRATRSGRTAAAR